MVDVDDVIQGLVLAHREDYDPVKRREYYLKTRKLIGRGTKKLGNPFNNDKPKPSSKNTSRQERLEIQKLKIRSQKSRAQRIKDPSKREKLLKKINAVEKKLTVGNLYNKVVNKQHSLVKRKHYGPTPEQDFVVEAVRTKRRFMPDTDNSNRIRVAQYKLDKMPKGPARDKAQKRLDVAIKRRDELRRQSRERYDASRKREKAAEAEKKRKAAR